MFGSSDSWFWLGVLVFVVIVIIPAIIIIALILFLVGRARRKQNIDPKNDPQWYLNPFLNKNDIISQGLMLVSYAFIPGILNMINRSLPNPIEWQLLVIIWAILGISYAFILKNVYVHIVAIIALFIGVASQLVIWSEQLNTPAQWFIPFLLWWIVGTYALGTLLLLSKPLQRFYLTHQALSIISILVLMFTLSTEAGLDIFRSLLNSKSLMMQALPLILTLIVIAGVSVGSIMVGLIKKSLHAAEAIILAILIALGIGLLLSSNNNTYNNYNNDYYYNSYNYSANISTTGYAWSIAFNLIALLLPVAIMVSGVHRQEKWRINLGIVAVFIICVIKYFDWFYSFLDKSLFFIIAGALLLGLGYFLERLRRYVVNTQLQKI